MFPLLQAPVCSTVLCVQLGVRDSGINLVCGSSRSQDHGNPEKHTVMDNQRSASVLALTHSSPETTHPLTQHGGRRWHCGNQALRPLQWEISCHTLMQPTNEGQHSAHPPSHLTGDLPPAPIVRLPLCSRVPEYCHEGLTSTMAVGSLSRGLHCQMRLKHKGGANKRAPGKLFISRLHRLSEMRVNHSNILLVRDDFVTFRFPRFCRH